MSFKSEKQRRKVFALLSARQNKKSQLLNRISDLVINSVPARIQRIDPDFKKQARFLVRKSIENKTFNPLETRILRFKRASEKLGMPVNKQILNRKIATVKILHGQAIKQDSKIRKLRRKL